MFEFIGMAAVAWVLWTVVKAFFAAVRKQREELAIAHAFGRYGIEPEVSRDILDDAEHIRQTRRLLASVDAEFASHSAGLQLGETVVYIYRNVHQPAKKWVDDLTEEVRASMTANRGATKG